MEDAKFTAVLDRHQRDPANLLAMLQDIQKEENYLPREDLLRLAKELAVPITRIYGLATFFKAFSLKPRGKHICTVCMGTACHVRGAPRLVEQVEREFSLKAGETTPDRKLTLETVNCVGACALGPLLIVDGEYHGNMTTGRLPKLVDSVLKEGKS